MKIFPKEHLFYFLSFVINTLFIIYVFSTIPNNELNNFFSSDCLYFPSIYKDVFTDHNAIQGWYLNSAPGFFPDMFFYFILMWFFKNFVVATFLFAIIQYNVFLFLVNRIFRIISPSISLVHLSIANLIMTLFFMVTTISNDFSFTYYLINNGFHFGPFIMCLICLIFAFNYLKNGKNKNLAFVFLFGFLAVISDRLFIILFCIPMCCVCVATIKKENSKLLMKLLACNIALVIAGLWAFLKIKTGGVIFIEEPHKIMDYSNIPVSVKVIANQYKKYLLEGSVKTIIVLITCVSTILTTVLGFKLFIRYRSKKQVPETASWLMLCYILFSLFFIPIVFLSPVLNGNYTGLDTIRYNIYSLYWGVFNCGFLVFYYFKNHKYVSLYTNIISLCLLFSLLIFFIKINATKGFDHFINYYPARVQQIDSLARVYNLKYGVAGYWDAKFTTMFSKQNLRVYAVYDDFAPYTHVTNSNWFYDSEKGDYNHPLYNFVVMDYINDTSFFHKLFGNTSPLIKTKVLDVRKVFNFKFDKNTFHPVKQ